MKPAQHCNTALAIAACAADFVCRPMSERPMRDWLPPLSARLAPRSSFLDAVR